VYVCVCARAHAHKCICICTYTPTTMHARTHTRTHARTHAHTHPRTRARAHTHTNTHKHTHTHTCIHMQVDQMMRLGVRRQWEPGDYVLRRGTHSQNVSARVHFLYETTIENTFENVCARRLRAWPRHNFSNFSKVFSIVVLYWK